MYSIYHEVVESIRHSVNRTVKRPHEEPIHAVVNSNTNLSILSGTSCFRNLSVPTLSMSVGAERNPGERQPWQTMGTQ